MEYYRASHPSDFHTAACCGRRRGNDLGCGDRRRRLLHGESAHVLPERPGNPMPEARKRPVQRRAAAGELLPAGSRPARIRVHARSASEGIDGSKNSSRATPRAAVMNALATTEPGLAAFVATDICALTSGAINGTALVLPTTGRAPNHVCGTMLAHAPLPTCA